MSELSRIAIVDEHPLFLQGVARTIERSGTMAVVAKGKDSRDANIIVESNTVDLLLIDSSMAGALEAIATIASGQQGIRIVALTSSDDAEHLHQVLMSGAHAYLLKGVNGNELLVALATVLRGEPYISLSLASRVIMQSKGKVSVVREPIAPTSRLTSREKAVIEHLREGLTNAEIAGRLGVSVGAVKHNVGNVFRKLRVRNRVSLLNLLAEELVTS